MWCIHTRAWTLSPWIPTTLATPHVPCVVTHFLQLLKMSELSLVQHLQKGYVNFYNPDALMP